ncbi:MAG: hypothetical protein Q8P05_00710 [Candidatus Diapherotrites archaeon]|nr:hypothetical protein [Candidatus Diapherotrites archaeon]
MPPLKRVRRMLRIPILSDAREVRRLETLTKVSPRVRKSTFSPTALKRRLREIQRIQKLKENLRQSKMKWKRMLDDWSQNRRFGLPTQRIFNYNYAKYPLGEMVLEIMLKPEAVGPDIDGVRWRMRKSQKFELIPIYHWSTPQFVEGEFIGKATITVHGKNYFVALTYSRKEDAVRAGRSFSRQPKIERSESGNPAYIFHFDGWFPQRIIDEYIKFKNLNNQFVAARTAYQSQYYKRGYL